MQLDWQSLDRSSPCIVLHGLPYLAHLKGSWKGNIFPKQHKMVHDQLSVLYRSEWSGLFISNNSLRAERYAKFQTKIQTWNQRIPNDEPNGDNRDLIENSIDCYTANRLMHENRCQPQMQSEKQKSNLFHMSKIHCIQANSKGWKRKHSWKKKYL